MTDAVATPVDEPASSNAAAVLVSLVFAVIYAGCWFVLGQSIPAGITCCAIACVNLLVVCVLLDGSRAWLSPAFWAAIAILLVAVGRPLVDLATSADSFQLGISVRDTYGPALKMISLGSICLGLGYAMMPSSTSRMSRSSRWVEPDWSVLKRRIFVLSVIVTVLTFLFVIQAGGPASLLEGRSTNLLSTLQVTSGYLYSAPQWLLPCGLYVWVLGLRSASRKLKRLGLGIAFASQIVSILLGDRSYFLVAIICLVLLRFMVIDRNPKLFIVVLLVPFVVILGLVLPRNYRDNVKNGGSLDLAWKATVTELKQTGGASFLLSDDFSMARNLALALRVVPSKQQGYTYGETYFAALARPIPKQLFPGGKPKDADTVLNEVSVYQFEQIKAGFSYTFVSEPFLNFGLGGVVVLCFLAGVGLRRCRDWFRSAEKTDIRAICLYAILSASMIVLVRGNLGTDYQRVLYYVLPLLYIVRGKRRVGRPGEALAQAEYTERNDARELRGAKGPPMPASRWSSRSEGVPIASNEVPERGNGLGSLRSKR